jgi:hypothetical protein
MRATLRIAFVLLALLVASPSFARSAAGFLVDGVVGVSVPVADSNWADTYYPGPIFGLHLGAEVWLARHVGLAPEMALDGGPLIDKGSGRATAGRFRMQPGLRVLIGFGGGHALFFRWLIGAELLAYGPGGTLGAGAVNVGFATEPGFGMQFRVARHAVIGFVLGVPIGVHSLEAPSEANVDFSASFFIGWRR